MASGPEKEKETPADDAGSPADAGASASGEIHSSEPVPPANPSGTLSADDPAPSAESAPAASEQLGLPGLPEETASSGPPTDSGHPTGEYDQYHDEYHEEHHYNDYDEYHPDEYHQDGHHDDYHYHDNHYEDPQHSAYRRAGGAAAATAAASGPLDQRSVPDYEPELDEDGNPYGGPVKPFLDHL
jgi:hypothetical protein